MLKVLVGFFIGIILTGALFLGPFRPATTRAETTPETGVSDNQTAIDLSSVDIKQMLNDAGSKITDVQTQNYYQTLMNNYQIDKLPSASERTDQSDIMQVLPDMGRVTNSAITTPLEEVGKQIHDKDIARFYQKLLDDAGWGIKIQSP